MYGYDHPRVNDNDSQMDSGMLGARERKRKFQPKARTGCRTCKKRRVKCDEQRPECLKCVKLGGADTCEGYEFILPAPSSSSTSRALIPRSPPSPTILSPEQNAYYSYFCDNTQDKLSFYFGIKLWSRPILQACQDIPFVRNAIIAIAALDKCLSSPDSQNRSPSSSYPYGVMVLHESPHHVVALQHFGLAIRQMYIALSASQSSSSKPPCPSPTTLPPLSSRSSSNFSSTPSHKSSSFLQNQLRFSLLGCLLTYTFEAWSGRHSSSLVHIQAGLSLLQSWLSRKRYSSHGPPTSFPPTTSPDPNILEDDLINTFARLDINVLNYIDIRPPPAHSLVAVDTLPEPEWPTFSTSHYRHQQQQDPQLNLNGPMIFSTMAAALAHWQPLLNRIFTSLLTFRPPIPHPPCHLPTCTPFRPCQPPNVKGGCAIGRLKIPDMFVTIRDGHVFEVEAWWSKFLALLYGVGDPGAAITKGEGEVDKILLALQARFTMVILKTSFWADEKGYDDLEAEFRFILLLWTRGLKVAGKGRKGRMTPGRRILYTCGLKCRERNLRRQALIFLKDLGTGIGEDWDCKMMAAVVEWVIEVEEEGVEEGSIVPEARRLCLVGMDVDIGERITTVRCVQGRHRGRKEARVRW